MMNSPAPIPIPLRQRLHEIRLRAVPMIVFLAAFITIGLLWRDYVAAPTMVGQAEPVLANVSCSKPGLLAEFTVARFQRVKAGDPVGRVIVADPKVLASSLAVIQAEIEMLRVNMKPITDQQRNAMNYDQLRLDWMKQRAQLATARVNLGLAETEYRRTEELFRDKIVAQRIFEQAAAARERLQKEVEELTKQVGEGEAGFKRLQLTNTTEIAKVSNDPLLAAIAVQESKLRLTEAELSPIELRAPMDGLVSMVYCRAGEAVTAGQPIASIATVNPVRIVGYLRAPILSEPKVGMPVQIRTRGMRREIGSATVLEVGAQLESVPAAVLGPAGLARTELGLPVDISIPANLRIRPGELVDITLTAQPD
jgi:multidrug resistance efflux pump